jgi:hypothetical protein
LRVRAPRRLACPVETLILRSPRQAVLVPQVPTSRAPFAISDVKDSPLSRRVQPLGRLARRLFATKRRQLTRTHRTASIRDAVASQTPLNTSAVAPCFASRRQLRDEHVLQGQPTRPDPLPLEHHQESNIGVHGRSGV